MQAQGRKDGHKREQERGREGEHERPAAAALKAAPSAVLHSEPRRARQGAVGGRSAARPSGTAVVMAFVAMGEEAGSCRCAGAARRSQGGEAG